ncbi:hypothetical protein GWK47_013977 [Chionoecetes opilio]|uniref:Uncharacterized protein n=1 Tax=Chionoecetes opilio TaxID=41210 RepID=A0A8J4XTV2_CHIOP|nr:hypothetical protein GWK47_013977 [Chionoecetes opilio]
MARRDLRGWWLPAVMAVVVVAVCVPGTAALPLSPPPPGSVEETVKPPGSASVAIPPLHGAALPLRLGARCILCGPNVCPACQMVDSMGVCRHIFGCVVKTLPRPQWTGDQANTGLALLVGGQRPATATRKIDSLT